MQTIEKLVKPNTSKLAINRGYNKPCRAYFDSTLNEYVILPTQSEIQTWLREIHKINIYILPRFSDYDGAQCNCHYAIYKENGIKDLSKFGNGSYLYQDALETALREALLLL